MSDLFVDDEGRVIAEALEATPESQIVLENAPPCGTAAVGCVAAGRAPA